MLQIKDGKIVGSKVIDKIESKIEKGAMSAVHGIIVHQTGGSTAASAFSSYAAGNAGAHLLIDKDGTIYQTARLNQVAWHIGKLRPRCVVELTCPAPKKWDPSGTHRTEIAKAWPARYPSNFDSIGIEIVSAFDSKKSEYEAVTAEQNASLTWIVSELIATLGLVATEVFRHPDVSYKQATEAATAKWN